MLAAVAAVAAVAGDAAAASPRHGPHVMPGTYTVALMADGREVERKPMRVIMDPEVRFTDATRRRYNEIVMDLHDMQRRGTPVASTLSELAGEVRRASTAIGSSNAPADVKAQFASFKTGARRLSREVRRADGGSRYHTGAGRTRGRPWWRRRGARPERVRARQRTQDGNHEHLEFPSDALVKQYAGCEGDADAGDHGGECGRHACAHDEHDAAALQHFDARARSVARRACWKLGARAGGLLSLPPPARTALRSAACAWSRAAARASQECDVTPERFESVSRR